MNRVLSIRTALQFVLLALVLLVTGHAEEPRKPTLFLIGDSTVKNNTRGQVGWGTPLRELFDGEKIRLENRALGGRSSRSYLREGLWAKVLAEIKPGDFVLMQFGHNDNGPLDEGKARASIKGNGDEAREVTIKESGATETVHSYGWYLRRYIADAKAKGATPIVCSLVPRNIWKDGKVVRSTGDFVRWAREAAEQGGAQFIDLHEIVARRYEALGRENVQPLFTPADHTHTSKAGAEFNATCVADGLRQLRDSPLAALLTDEPRRSAASESR
jgi:lysophospholipase L1-like esterase